MGMGRRRLGGFTISNQCANPASHFGGLPTLHWKSSIHTKLEFAAVGRLGKAFLTVSAARQGDLSLSELPNLLILPDLQPNCVGAKSRKVF